MRKKEEKKEKKYETLPCKYIFIYINLSERNTKYRKRCNWSDKDKVCNFNNWFDVFIMKKNAYIFLKLK